MCILSGFNSWGGGGSLPSKENKTLLFVINCLKSISIHVLLETLKNPVSHIQIIFMSCVLLMLWSHKVARPATHTLRPIFLSFRVPSLR